MFEDGRYLGPSAAMPGVRACWLLRFIEKQTRDETFSHIEAPRGAVAGAWRELDVVLRRRSLCRRLVRGRVAQTKFAVQDPQRRLHRFIIHDKRDVGFRRTLRDCD